MNNAIIIALIFTALCLQTHNSLETARVRAIETIPFVDEIVTTGTATRKKSLDRASLETMSRTLLGECGRCGDAEIKAIGHVIKNRLKSGRYGNEIADVVTFKRKSVYAFSTWDARFRNEAVGPHVDGSKAFARMKRLAADVWQEDRDPTGGAVNFYHPRSMKIRNSIPHWAKGKIGQRIGGAIFFR